MVCLVWKGKAKEHKTAAFQPHLFLTYAEEGDIVWVKIT